jgi:hypothetical protein
MSHLESGFCITDLEALTKTVQEKCSDLEMVKGKVYRTWATDHGSLAGDYPLPGIYQLQIVAALKKAGHDVHKLAQAVGVKLPDRLMELETQGWSAQDQNKLLQNPEFKKEYHRINAEVIGKDAEYIIRYKATANQPRAYEIGVVPNPARKGEYQLMCDYYNQGNGLLRAKGLGQNTSGNKWGGELKQAYAALAAERAITAQIAAGNPEYGSYTKIVLPDGRIKIEVTPR